MRCYLDHNATTPARPAAIKAAQAAIELGGNASAITSEGRKARHIIEDARAGLAALVGAEAKNVTFVSGGSEAAATLLSPNFGLAKGARASRLIVSSIEHSCVLAGGRFALGSMTQAQVTPGGMIDTAKLKTLFTAAGETVLMALMLANNETGIVQPVREVADIVHKNSGYLVVDAVQALGKLDFKLADTGADALFISGHKIGALPGIGAIIRASSDIQSSTLIKGGGQENNLRAGTENLPGIASLGAAAAELALAGPAERAKMEALRDWMESRIITISPEAKIIGQGLQRLPNTSCISLKNAKAETVVIGLDLAGVTIGAGSACTSGKMAPSHVLKAMGMPSEEAQSVIRLSLGWSTTKDDTEFFLAQWAKICAKNGSKVA